MPVASLVESTSVTALCARRATGAHQRHTTTHHVFRTHHLRCTQGAKGHRQCAPGALQGQHKPPGAHRRRTTCWHKQPAPLCVARLTIGRPRNTASMPQARGRFDTGQHSLRRKYRVWYCKILHGIAVDRAYHETGIGWSVRSPEPLWLPAPRDASGRCCKVQVHRVLRGTVPCSTLSECTMRGRALTRNFVAASTTRRIWPLLAAFTSWYLDPKCFLRGGMNGMEGAQSRRVL